MSFSNRSRGEYRPASMHKRHYRIIQPQAAAEKPTAEIVATARVALSKRECPRRCRVMYGGAPGQECRPPVIRETNHAQKQRSLGD